MKILCLWFPRWPLERLFAAQPELRGQRVLLYEQTPRGNLQIVAATDASLRPGMPLAEALASAECGARNAESKNNSAIRNPHSAILPHDPWADRQALIELADRCRQFSPTVGLEDTPRPACLFLDLTGLEQCGLRDECGMRSAECGVKETLAESIVDSALFAGFTIRAAVAPTLGAAWALAHYGMPSAPHPASLRTPIHSALRTPQSALAPLPVAALRLPHDTLALLGRLGLHRVGQVEALPRAALASRFGPQLLLRLDQMFGRTGEALLIPRAAVEFNAECSFDSPVEDQETIRTACRGLVRQIAPLLAARQEGVTQLECRLDCSPEAPAALLVGLFRPSASAEHLWQLLRLRLESLRLPGPVTAVRLEVRGSAPLAWQQQELFATDRRVNFARQAAPLVDRLSNRLGRQAVVRPVPLEDAQPEYAWMSIPLAGRSSRNPVPAARRGKRPAGIPAASENGFHLQERPALLKTQPIALRRVQTRGRQPQAFHLGGSKHLLQRTWGPERIETGWWRTGLIRRDYYRVETSDGSRFWIFQDLRSQTWFLHGEFG